MAERLLLQDDYSEGMCPQILSSIVQTNLEQHAGYGNDKFSEWASEWIKIVVENSEADVHFVPTGTSANKLLIKAALRPFEAVISAETGHINTHEAGAIESTGHKIVTVPEKDGKVLLKDIQNKLDFHEDEHMVLPRMVYISNATELGTVYTKSELKKISQFCKEHNLLLFMDGARLGSALVSYDSNVTLRDIASLTDAFYIGGTKNGAPFGEAIVIINPQLQENFRFYMKQEGALIAKSRFLGISFFELFRQDAWTYLDNARRANEKADKLRQAIQNLGYSFLVDSLTNQLFPIMPVNVIEQLKEKYGFYVWKEIDRTRSAIRLVTSWATTDYTIDSFVEDLNRLTKSSI